MKSKTSKTVQFVFVRFPAVSKRGAARPSAVIEGAYVCERHADAFKRDLLADYPNGRIATREARQHAECYCCELNRE